MSTFLLNGNHWLKCIDFLIRYITEKQSLLRIHTIEHSFYFNTLQFSYYFYMHSNISIKLY